MECASHPGADAVRKCSRCGKLLCQVCLVEVAGEHYCSGCLPAEGLAGALAHLDFAGDVRPAGFFARAAVTILETAVLLWLLDAVFPAQSATGSKIAFQALAVAAFVSYFYLFTANWGATPLQRLAGLSVIDSGGEPSSRASALVRTGYLVLTIMAIVPALGYLAMVRDEYNRAWIDRLSGTVVVTSNSSLTNTIGSLALLVLVGLGWLNTNAITAKINTIFDQAHAQRSRKFAGLEVEWEKSSEKSSMAVLDNKTVVAIVNGNVAAFSVADGVRLWVSQAKNTKRVFTDPYFGYYIVYEGTRDGEASLTAISKTDGSTAWRRKLAMVPEHSPRFDRKFIYISAGGHLLAIARSGSIAWDKDIGALSGPYVANSRILAEVETDLRYGTIVLETRRGNEVGFVDDVAPVSPVGNGNFLLAGEEETVMVDTASVQSIWTADEKLSFLSGPEPNVAQPIIYSETRPVSTEDGDAPFSYPEGCLFAGRLSSILVFSCPGERVFRVVNSVTGQTLNKIKGQSFTEASAIYIDDYSYYTIVTNSNRTGKKEVALLWFDRLKNTASFRNLGQFDSGVSVSYLPESGGLYISSAGLFGVYKTPWKTD